MLTAIHQHQRVFGVASAKSVRVLTLGPHPKIVSYTDFACAALAGRSVLELSVLEGFFFSPSCCTAKPFVMVMWYL